MEEGGCWLTQKLMRYGLRYGWSDWESGRVREDGVSRWILLLNNSRWAGWWAWAWSTRLGRKIPRNKSLSYCARGTHRKGLHCSFETETTFWWLVGDKPGLKYCRLLGLMD